MAYAIYNTESVRGIDVNAESIIEFLWTNLLLNSSSACYYFFCCYNYYYFVIIFFIHRVNFICSKSITTPMTSCHVSNLKTLAFIKFLTFRLRSLFGLSK